MRNHAMQHHNISRETLSVRERMTQILSVLKIGEFCEFSTCFMPEEGRQGIVVTFLAILELGKESSIDIVQSAPYAPIYLKSRSSVMADGEEGDEGERVLESELIDLGHDQAEDSDPGESADESDETENSKPAGEQGAS